MKVLEPLSRSLFLSALCAIVVGCSLLRGAVSSTPERPAARTPAGPPCPPPTAGDGDDVPFADRGFVPLTLEGLRGGAYVGKTVWYVGTGNGSYDEVLAGDPLRLCEVKMSGSTKTLATGERIETTAPTLATVTAANGQSTQISVLMLSSNPLAFSQRNTGPADGFVKGLFKEIYRVGMMGYRIAERYEFRTPEYVDSNGAKDVNWDWKIQFNLRNSVRSDLVGMLHGIVQGGAGREGLLSSSSRQWIANAQDDLILDWHVDGALNAPEGALYEAMRDCGRTMENMNAALHSLEVAIEEKETKPWREHIASDVPERQRARLDQDEERERDRDITELRARIAKDLKDPNCKKALKVVPVEI